MKLRFVTISRGILLLLLATIIASCGQSTNNASIVTTSPAALDLSKYAFPAAIDPQSRYLFYLHGKTIEDQGLPAVSPDYGEYQYGPILEALAGHGYIVISEQRAKDTDGFQYAGRVADQVTRLLDAGVPAGNIVVVGASKGAGIALLTSYRLKNDKINYVLMGICSPDTVEQLEQQQVTLYGNVLSIYEASDDLGGSCAGLFEASQGKGLARHEEIALHTGLKHGFLFKPMDEWLLPAVQWANP